MLRDKRVWGIAAVVLLGFGAWLAFGFFGIHKAFVDDKVTEEGPIFASGAQLEDTVVSDADNKTEETTVVPSQPVAATEKTGSFTGLKNYSVAGTANILSDGQERFLRFEEGFESSNGPDLKVYLRADSGEFINLGKLKGNKGSQNYEVDISVDLDKYKKVEIWCERFSVGFGSANLA